MEEKSFIFVKFAIFFKLAKPKNRLNIKNWKI